MLTISNFYNLTNKQIILITSIILLIMIIIVLTSFLIVLSNYKNKQLIIFKNLQYMQTINIKERLIRIKKIAIINKQYNTILGIWITRYHFFLKKDLANIFSIFITTTELHNNKKFLKSYQLLRKTYHKSKTLKHQMQLLITEIDYFISIDQLLREYQLFFKQNFNFLQAETIKINLQNTLNQEQLDEIIKIINEMFKVLETSIDDANFTKVITILSEIAISVVTLAEILANLPPLRYLVTNKIQPKMLTLKNKCQIAKINNTLLIQYQTLEAVVNDKLDLITSQINNLQYKKAKTKTQEILQKISNFENKIAKEQTIFLLFKQCYERYLVFNFAFNDIFAIIKNQIKQLKSVDDLIVDDEKVTMFETTIVKQLAVFNHFENLLIVEKQKSEKTTDCQILLMLLKELFENSIIVFNSLNEYNKLLLELSKPKIRFEIYLNKINSMMLQIDNLLTNINFYFLLNKYEAKFNALQQLVNDTVHMLRNGQYSDQLFAEFSSLQNKIFQLYTEIKIEINIHELSHATLIYANRYRTINQQLEQKFNEIENNINNNYYQEALTKLLELMQ